MPPAAAPAAAMRSHVQLHDSRSAPVTVALTGRAHQRFDGQRRLVCGAVAFRVDAANESDPAAEPTVAASSAPTLRVLLVQSKKKNEWIFPKGGWEQFESARECAARESLEESGVSGVMLAALAPVEFASKKGKQSRLYPFLMQVTEQWSDWAEARSRERRWFDWTEVAGVMQRQETKAVWADAVGELTRLGFTDAQGGAVFQQPPSTPPHIDEPVAPAGSTAAEASAVAPPSSAAAASSSSLSAAPASSLSSPSPAVSGASTPLHALRFSAPDGSDILGSVSVSSPPPQRDVSIDVAQLRRQLESHADAAGNAATAAGAVDSATDRCVAASVPASHTRDRDCGDAAAAASATSLLLPSSSPHPVVCSAVLAPAAPRLLDLALLGIKSNFLPGLALQGFALLLTVLYYTSASVNAAFDVVARWKDEGGYVFSGAVTSVAAGILPFILILSRRVWRDKQRQKQQMHDSDSRRSAKAVGPSMDGVELSVVVAGAAAAPAPDAPVWHDGASLPWVRSVSSPCASGPAIWKETVFLIVFWFYKGVEIDAFYRLQTVLWGPDNAPGTIIAKVLTDQFVFSVVWNEYSIVSAYLWKDGDFSFGAWVAHMRSRHFWTRTLPTTWCTTWLVWVPILFIMYALPDPLQIPLFAIVSCFYSILIDFITQNNK